MEGLDFVDGGVGQQSNSSLNGSMNKSGFQPMMPDHFDEGTNNGFTNGFNTETGNAFGDGSTSGFKPANWGFQPSIGLTTSANPMEDDLTEEERERIEMIEKEQEERKRKLYEKQTEEEE